VNRALAPDNEIWTMTQRKWGYKPQQHKTCTGAEPRGNLNIVFRLLIFVFICTIAITLRLHAINEKTNKQTIGFASLASQHGMRNCIYKRTCPPTILFPLLFSLHSYLFMLPE
jgi:hypothetical protein